MVRRPKADEPDPAPLSSGVAEAQNTTWRKVFFLRDESPGLVADHATTLDHLQGAYESPDCVLTSRAALWALGRKASGNENPSRPRGIW